MIVLVYLICTLRVETHNVLCDVTLIVGTKRIAAHRIVLSSASDYFAAMFTSDVREATQEEVKLQDVDAEALATLVHYMYTGTCGPIALYLNI